MNYMSQSAGIWEDKKETQTNTDGVDKEYPPGGSKGTKAVTAVVNINISQP